MASEPSIPAAQIAPAVRSPVRSEPLWLRVIDALGSIPFGVGLLIAIFLYCGIGSAAAPVRQGILADWFGIEALRFDKTEMAWFGWWPFQVLIGLLCLSLVITTIRRTPLNAVKAGVWITHAGLIALAGSAAYYFGTKIEGDVVIFQARALVLAAGMSEPASLLLRPDAALTVPAAGGEYHLRVARMDPQFPLPASAGEPAAPAYELAVTGPNGLNFTRRLVLGHAGLTVDLPADSAEPTDTSSKLLIDPSLQIALDYAPARYLYHAHNPPVHSVGAIYVRISGATEWTQYRLHGLPHYHDWLAHRQEVWPSLAADLPPVRAMDLIANPADPGEALPGLRLRVTDYLTQAELRPGWEPGGDTVYPLLNVSVLREGASSSFLMQALDREADKLPLATGGTVRFAWAADGAERNRLLGPPAPAIEVHLAGRTEPIVLPLAAMEVGTSIPAGDSGYAVELLQLLPAGRLQGEPMPAMAVVAISRAGRRSERVVVADSPVHNLELDADRKPTTELSDPDIELRYVNPPQDDLLLVGGPGETDLAALRYNGRGQAESVPVAIGATLPLADGVSLRIDRLDRTGRRVLRPALIPATQREPIDRLGMHRSVVRVELDDGAGVQSVWLPFSHYAFESEQGAQPGRFAWSPRTLPLADGRRIELLYSRWRDPLPVEIALERFVLRTYPGGEHSSDYISLIRFADGPGLSPIEEVRSNRPRRHGDLWFFQSQWDPGTQAHTVLGVGNRPGATAMLIAVLISIAGMVYSFYIKPVLIRRALAGRPEPA